MGKSTAYCYICWKDGPCTQYDICNTLGKRERDREYREGYFNRHSDGDLADPRHPDHPAYRRRKRTKYQALIDKARDLRLKSEKREAASKYKESHPLCRSIKSLARSRDENAKRRLNPKPAEGALGFYCEMLLAKTVYCRYCKSKLATYDRVGDHYVPLAKGGLHTADNLVIACAPCNLEKSDMMPEDFLAKRKARRFILR